MKNGILKVSIGIIILFLLSACGNQPEPPPPDIPDDQQPRQEIIFFPDQEKIPPGGCTIIHWEVTGSYLVTINDQEVPAAGEMEVCLEESQVFVLSADMGDRVDEGWFEIIVQAGNLTEDEIREQEAAAVTGPREVPERPEIIPGTPAYQSGTWQHTSGPPGGLGYDIRMDPRNSDVMYVTDAWAGAFKSLDGGENWFPINNGITTRTGRSGDGIPVFCLSIDPNHPDTLWAGTQFASTVFRSDDAGASWRSMSRGILEERMTIRGITVEPGNSDVVYLAGEISSWEWNHGEALPGVGLDMTKGAVYKTTDGGQNWKRIWYGDNLARYILIKPEDHNLIYVSTGIFDREAANSNKETQDPGGVGVLRSRDGGNTWDVLGVENGFQKNELQVSSLFMHPENPDVLIGAVANDSYLYWIGQPLGAIYLTENGGEHWERVLALDNASTVEICTSDPNVIYAGSFNGIHRSDDGGHTWQETMGFLWGTEDVLAGFPIDMLCDPHDPMRIFVNNYIGGNFLSEDGGFTWKLASKGYTGAMVSQVAVSYTDPAYVYNATRMGVFVSQDGGDKWNGTAHKPARAPEGIVVAVDRWDDNHILSIFVDAGPDPWVSWDSGKSWVHVDTGFHGPGTLDIGLITDIFFSSHDPMVVLATAGSMGCKVAFDRCEDEPGHGMIRSTDRGFTWSQTSLTDVHITDLKFVNQTQVYAAAYPDSVYRSNDGGQTWELLAQGIMPKIALDADTDPEMMKQYSILSIAIDPFNNNHVLTGFKDGGVKISRDGGQSWNTVAAGLLPELSADVLVADPAHEGVFYLGSANFGIFYSTDSGASWTMLNKGLTNRLVTDLALSSDGSVLYLATDGGGVFQLGYQGE